MLRWLPALALLACATTSTQTERAPADTASREAEPRDDLGPVFHVPVDNSAQLGRPDAAITVVAFTDFECRFCARALPTLAALRQRYGDDIRIVFRHFPLSFHRRAPAAHEIAQEILHAEGNAAFWRFHDALFADRANLDPETLEQLAGPHYAALADHRHRTTIEADIELGRRLGVRGTPTFFFNGRRLSGARPLGDMIAYADDAALRAQIARNEGASSDEVYARIIAEGLREQPSEPEPSDVLPAAPPVPEHAPRRGSDDPDALVIHMFSDFECRYCARALDTVLRVLEQYPDEVALVYRHMPLRSHRNARAAANASIEAQRLGGDAKFWEAHDRLLEHSHQLGPETYAAIARELDLDAAQIQRAAETNAHGTVIAADLRTARAVGASGTPTFVIGDRVLRGARPFLEFEEIIDDILYPEGVE